MAWNIDGILEKIGLLKDDSVGIAFGGGGARGFSHIGVLKAFESFGVRPDIMSGVSAGAIAVALYGSGLSPYEMRECFIETGKLSNFTEWALPKKGFMRMDKFGALLESWLLEKRLEDFRIPSVICATDFDNGKSVGWTKGEVVPRVMASCSIPVVFQPVRINGVNYVDGGVLRNLPAWVIRQYCSVLYGSNCSPMKRMEERSGSLLDIALRSFHLMMKSNTPQDLRLCDYVIQSQSLAYIGTFELSSLDRAMNAGYDAACVILEKSLGRRQ